MVSIVRPKRSAGRKGGIWILAGLGELCSARPASVLAAGQFLTVEAPGAGAAFGLRGHRQHLSLV
eukprot:13507902-Alexandrium_andersonii.AAC.1